MIKIAIRIDDVTKNMDWDKFSRFEAILDKYKVCPLIGVIPENQDDTLLKSDREDYSDWLARRVADGWSVAVHGRYHKYTTKKGGVFPLNCFSEFAGLSYERQYELLSGAVDCIKAKGLLTDIFMAPAHTFDVNTIKALKKLGFKYITDGFGYNPYERDGMVFLPISSRKGKDVERSDGYTTIVYHPAMMNDRDFDNFEKLLDRHKDQLINYSELLEVPVLHQGFVERLGEWWMATAKRVIVKLKG